MCLKKRNNSRLQQHFVVFQGSSLFQGFKNLLKTSLPANSRTVTRVIF